ncbi:MAG: NmrA family NAD(P)-binding protein [Pseudomonadota bacterium]
MILVSGATGNVGRAVVKALHGVDKPVIALVRDPKKAASQLPKEVPLRIGDYTDPSTLTAAFHGVERFVFIPSDGDACDVLQHHANLIAAARAAGVAFTIFISIVDLEDTSPFYFTPVYRDAEKRLDHASLPHALIRCNLYAEFVRDHFLSAAKASSHLDAPFGDGAIAPVSRVDVAAVCAALVLRPELQGAHVSLSGPESLRGDEIAAIASEAWGRTIEYKPMPHPDYLHKLLQEQPAPWPHAFSSMAVSISQGRYADLQKGVAEILGRAPMSLADVLATR